MTTCKPIPASTGMTQGHTDGSPFGLKVRDTVVLGKDLPTHGLRQGDVGAVVEAYEPDGLEVEFVTGSGRTQALVTLKAAEVRLITDTDILAVRSLRVA